MESSPLETALQQLSLHPLITLVSRTLTRSGYGEAQLQNRLKEKQKSRQGGCDLLFEATFGTREVRVAVKVVRDTIRIRMLDEMCGVVRRTKADMGFLVTPFSIGKRAKELLASYRPEIQVIDGAALAGLMETYGIGTKGTGEVDYEFFQGLEHYSERTLDLMQELKDE